MNEEFNSSEVAVVMLKDFDKLFQKHEVHEVVTWLKGRQKDRKTERQIDRQMNPVIFSFSRILMI